MSGLALLWLLSLAVTLAALPQALERTVAYRSGEVDRHTGTMLLAACVAVALTAAGAIGFAVTSALLAAA